MLQIETKARAWRGLGPGRCGGIGGGRVPVIALAHDAGSSLDSSLRRACVAREVLALRSSTAATPGARPSEVVPDARKDAAGGSEWRAPNDAAPGPCASCRFPCAAGTLAMSSGPQGTVLPTAKDARKPLLRSVAWLDPARGACPPNQSRRWGCRAPERSELFIASVPVVIKRHSHRHASFR